MHKYLATVILAAAILSTGPCLAADSKAASESASEMSQRTMHKMEHQPKPAKAVAKKHRSPAQLSQRTMHKRVKAPSRAPVAPAKDSATH